MGNELRLMVPRNVWADETTLAQWLSSRAVTGLFWEVVRYVDWIVIEVIE